MPYNRIIFIAFILLLWNCTNPKGNNNQKANIAKKSFTEKEVVRVKVAQVSNGNFAQELASNGKLSAKEKAVIPFLLNEQITNVKVHNGQRVPKGAIIAQLEPFKYRKQLNDARNQYEKTQIDLEDHLLGYGYAVKDTAKVPANILKMARIRSGYNQALSNLKDAQRNYSNTIIKAPFDGVVANLQASAYNPSSQYNFCCELIADALMQVEFTVLEGEMNQVRAGQSVEIIPFADNKKSYQGHITAVNPSIDEHGMISVIAEVKNKDSLIDGMNVKVLSKNVKPNCVIIPKSAVLYRQNRKVVFVKEDGIALWVYVETGDENSTQITIVDGSLQEGQEVIISNNNLNLAHETPVVSE